MTIAPIPTRYAGYHFRSRLEARWAVFFDALEIQWEYEPEGFNLKDGPYLPDFRIQDRRFGQVYVEVKPSPSKSADWRKALWFHYETGFPTLFLAGTPRPIPHTLHLANFDEVISESEAQWEMWMDASHKEMVYGTTVSFIKSGLAPLTREYFNFEASGDYLKGIDAARSARFEHGQSGATA